MDDLQNRSAYKNPENGLDFYNHCKILQSDSAAKMQGTHVIMSIRGLIKSDNNDSMNDTLSFNDVKSSYDHLTIYSYNYSKFYNKKPKRAGSPIKIANVKKPFQRIAMFEVRWIPSPRKFLETSINHYFQKTFLTGQYRNRRSLPFLILNADELSNFIQLPNPTITKNLQTTRNVSLPSKQTSKTGLNVGYFLRNNESTSDKELMAHELTHIVQNQRIIQRQEKSPKSNVSEKKQEFNCKNAPIKDVENLYRAFVSFGRSAGLIDAANMLEHFLSKKGTTRTLSHILVLKDSDAKQKRRSLMSAVIDLAFKIAQKEQKTKTCFEKRQTTYRFSKAINSHNTKAVWYTMGRFNMVMDSQISWKKNCNSSGNCVDFSFIATDSFMIDDAYDWHPGLKVTIPHIGIIDDLCAKRLEQAKRAKPFMMKVRWKEKQKFSLMCEKEGISYYPSKDDVTAYPPLPIPSKPIPNAPVSTPSPKKSQPNSDKSSR